MTTASASSEQESSSKPIFASQSNSLDDHWAQFTYEFPTEQDCVEELYRRVYSHDLKCLECGSERLRKLNNSRIVICSNCKKESHILAGTFFENIRSAKTWLGAIWFMEHGIAVSAFGFARLADRAYSTAHEMFKKLTLVLISKMTDLPEISSREFIRTFYKRSRITPTAEHPVAEQYKIEKEDTANLEIRKNTSDTDSILCTDQSNLKDRDSKALLHIATGEELGDLQKPVYEAMLAGKLHFDRLLEHIDTDPGKLSAALLMLELKGLVKPVPGNSYALSHPFVSPSTKQTYPQKQAKIMIGSFIDYVRSTFKGISRKYLQNYLGWYWCIIDRERWKPGALMKECVGFRQISYAEVLEYVSPVMVKLSFALI